MRSEPSANPPFLACAILVAFGGVAVAGAIGVGRPLLVACALLLAVTFELAGAVGIRYVVCPSDEHDEVERALRAVGWVGLCGLPATCLAVLAGLAGDGEPGSVSGSLRSPPEAAAALPFLWIAATCGYVPQLAFRAFGESAAGLALLVLGALRAILYRRWSGPERAWRNPWALAVGAFVLVNSLAGLRTLVAWMAED